MDEVAWLLDQGVPYIQLDNPHYPDYIEESRRQQWQAIGIEPEAEAPVSLIAEHIVDGRYLEASDEDSILIGKGLADRDSNR